MRLTINVSGKDTVYIQGFNFSCYFFRDTQQDNIAYTGPLHMREYCIKIANELLSIQGSYDV